MSFSKKYPRSLHAQVSLGTTSDDRFMPQGYVQAFAEMDHLILTEKLDGQNNCFNQYGLFARSHTSPTQHPWDKPLLNRWQLIKNDLKDLEIFGENMYGIHSIEYTQLESFFYVFGIRIDDYWLPWEEVEFYAALFDFPTVPQIEIQHPLKDYYNNHQKENDILEKWLTDNLGMTWEESVKTSGLLGGFDPNSDEACSEGFVIRNKNGFKTNEGILPTAHNEFDSIFKLVRASHVKTDVHWTKNWRKATLTDYSKYKWYGLGQ